MYTSFQVELPAYYMGVSYVQIMKSQLKSQRIFMEFVRLILKFIHWNTQNLEQHLANKRSVPNMWCLNNQ